MVSTSVPPADPLEAVVDRSRPRVEALLRAHALSLDEARTVLFDAIQWLESPQGVVPWAEQRMVRVTEAASRRVQGERVDPPQAETDFGLAFAELMEAIRRQRFDSALAKARTSEQLARLLPVGDTEASSAAATAGEASKELVGELLDRSRQAWSADPGLSLAITRRALDLLSRLPRGGIDSRFLWDLEGRAHAYAGNAKRLLFDYRLAEREFEASEAALAIGTQDPRERAQMLMHLAALRRDQRHFAQALALLQQAAAIYRWTRERHAEGLIYIAMANTEAYAGRPELALPLAARARDLLDHARDPRMSAGLEKNVAHYLFAADRPIEARQQVRLARGLVEAVGSPADLRGLRWIEGQIALALGEREEGESLLTAVREEYVQVGDAFNAALVSLELVAHYLDLGRAADAKRLAAESLPIFQSLEIHRETLAALIALQRATEMETATAGVVRELLERLRRGNATAPPRPEKPS